MDTPLELSAVTNCLPHIGEDTDCFQCYLRLLTQTLILVIMENKHNFG